ncbi:MAG: carbohydrate-binding family 6 protein, partial [Planctomycetes bacterium]|nr:carbohydrate-binding family 6 protein [Planctomycetota bacterium]
MNVVPKRPAFLLFIFITSIVSASTNCIARQKVAITYDRQDPRIAFAAGDIKKALLDKNYDVDGDDADVRIVFDIFQAGMGPQSFRIRREGGNTIRIVGGDSLGAMYGGLDVAEMVTLGSGLKDVQEKARKPYIFRRGLKFNIPFDGRAPSYDDTGTAAQKNIPVMWEFHFWQEFLDTLARNRYNVLTLWTTHPYPGLVKMDRYPDIGYDDVCVVKETINTKSDRHFDKLDIYDPSSFKVVKKISLDEKIAFWNRVFDLAEARGIEIHIFHWNIYTFGGKGRHGIDDMPDNEKTIAYMRYCIGEFLKTYPQVDGIGVTAGEHVNNQRVKKVGGIEQWLWRTYGQGVMDAKQANPDRKLRFIFRQHQANLGKITAAFKDFDGPFNTGHKYARARLYSTTTSPYLDFEYRKLLQEHKVPCWLNLRNDDLFIYRWGDADYVREFLQNVPRDLMRYEAGFYMGPDGFVFGREFVSKDPELSGELEVRKHWYRFMLWG